ncbi:MAG: lipoate--protein ligase [Clostridia bacterium]|nr:lipoate--protein ligase [Clostridia bacterium]
MLYIESDCNRPQFNLALEEFVFFQKKEEVFMLWQNTASIIVGKNQNTMAEIDYAYVTKEKIPVVRRLSGGGAVYHDLGNLNYTYIVNRDAYGDYVGFTKLLRDYLASLGLEAAVSGRNDVLVDGKKISGNAQYMHHNRLLHHGCILLGADMTRLAKALKPDEEKIRSKGVRSVSGRVANISDFIPITAEAFRTGFGAYVKAHTKAVPYILTKDERQAVEKLEQEKYDTFAWNFGHSPKYAFHTKNRFVGGGVEVFLDIQEGIIRDAVIYGDYLDDAESICRKLRGVPHNAEALKKVLSGVSLGTIHTEELLRCFL